MKKITGVTGAALLVVGALAVSGCTSMLDPEPSRSNPQNSPSESSWSETNYPTPAKTPNASPATLEPLWTPGEKVIASFATQHAGIDVGPYSTSTGFVAVYIRCVGKGMINITIPNSAGYSLECSPNDGDSGIRNISQIQTPKNFSIKVETSNLWSMALTEVEQPKIDISPSHSG